MTAFNAVRFRIKPGREQEFLEAHKKVAGNWSGLRRVALIKTGEGSYCIIGEWSGMAALAKARPNMITTLDTFRDTLEDLGGGLGVSDPVSGDVVMEIKRTTGPAARKTAKKPTRTVTKGNARRKNKASKKLKSGSAKRR